MVLLWTPLLSPKMTLGYFGKMGWKSIFKAPKNSSQALTALGVHNIAAAVYCFMESNHLRSTYSLGAVEYLSNLAATITLYTKMRYSWSQEENWCIYLLCTSAFSLPVEVWWKLHISYLRRHLKMRYVPLQSTNRTYFQLLSSQTAALSGVIKEETEYHLRRPRRCLQRVIRALFLHYWPRLDLQAETYFLHGNADCEWPTCVNSAVWALSQAYFFTIK